MLIRNVKSFADLERKKNLQAQLLQVQIDNESLLESRVSDYQNPNKPPPLPPQYKTSAELAQDTNFQQKEVIDNLLSINGVDNIMALGVSQELAQLPNGVGNFLIFNKNFPVIRKRIEDISKRNYNVSTLMNKIEEVLQQIDLGILYQSTGGVDANVGFNMAMGGAMVLPSGQDLPSLQAELQAGANPSSMYGLLLAKLYEIQNTPQSPLAVDADFQTMLGIVERLCEASPLQEYLDNFDLIEFMERQKLQKSIARLNSTYNIPKFIDIEFIENGIIVADYQQAVAQQPIQLPQNFERAYAKLLNKIRSIKTPVATSIGELRKVSDKILALLGGQVAVRQQLQGQLNQAQQAVAQANRNAIVLQNKQNMDALLQNPAQVRERILQQGVNPYTNVDYFPAPFLDYGATISGNQPDPNNPADIIIEIRDLEYERNIAGRLVKKSKVPDNDLPFTTQTTAGQFDRPIVNGEGRAIDPAILAGIDLNRFLFKNALKGFNVGTTQQAIPTRQQIQINYAPRYTEAQLVNILRNQEIDPLKQVLDNDPNYDPLNNQQQRKFPQPSTHGFGINKGKGLTFKEFLFGAQGQGLKRGKGEPQGFAEVMKQRSDDTNRAIAKPFVDAGEAVKATGRNVGNAISRFFGGEVMCPAVYEPVMKNGKMYSNACEASAYGGMLKPPRMCPQNFAPVRAKDGKIYGNRCKAEEGGGVDENYKGNPYAIDGMGFMNRKIKIGKGIAIQEEQPRYRTFGKYIIHMPFLENENVLNVKFKSMGSIPSIKPVSIDDNFKEFVMEILNTGQVNQKHYNSLTDAEKAHFHKIVKGAGLSNTLKFKADDKIDDKKDVKRLDVLVGQIVAGNDNDKVMKEAKELIKKCVDNGSITRHRGMDLLFQIE